MPTLDNVAMHRRRAAIDADLRTLEVLLPFGSEFRWSHGADVVSLDRLVIPSRFRGKGTEFLSKVLAVTDAHEVATTLVADPTDDPADPDTFELARWCARFGFSATGLDEQEGLVMRRESCPWEGGHEPILAHYAAAKAGADMSHEEFADQLDEFIQPHVLGTAHG